MRILIINAGGSSVRLATYEANSSFSQSLELINDRQVQADVDPKQAIFEFLSLHNKDNSNSSSSSSSGGKMNADDITNQADEAGITTIVHRIVHGGSKLTHPTIITPAVLKQLTEAEEIDPLHNTPAVHWVETCLNLFHTKITQVATFDTFFYINLPVEAKTYAVPLEWREKYGIHRYGFHGMAHQAMYNTFIKHSRSNQQKRDNHDINSSHRLLSLQLGSGCSITAVLDGHPLDTSMGFSPLEGLVMTTRVGDIDPSIIIYMMTKLNLTPDSMQNILYKQSGLFALSNQQSKDVKTLIESNTTEAKIAIDIFVYKIVKYIGSYVAVMGGVDDIIFGGGIGEHSGYIRERIINKLNSFLQIQLNKDINKQNLQRSESIKCLSSNESKVHVWVVQVDEAAIMAEQAFKLLAEDKGNK